MAIIVTFIRRSWHMKLVPYYGGVVGHSQCSVLRECDHDTTTSHTTMAALGL